MKEVSKDPKVFVEALNAGNIRMLTSQMISHYFVMNFFGYSAIKRNFRYFPIKKLKELVETPMTDDELIKLLDENFDLYYKDMLTIMAKMESSEEIDFISAIPDDELKRIVTDASPEIILDAFNNVSESTLDLFARKLYGGGVENFAVPFVMSWVGIR